MERPDCRLVLMGDYDGGVSLTCECLRGTGVYIYGNHAAGPGGVGLQADYSLEEMIEARDAHLHARSVERRQEQQADSVEVLRDSLAEEATPDTRDYLERMARLRRRLAADLKVPYGLVGYMGEARDRKGREAAALARIEERYDLVRTDDDLGLFDMRRYDSGVAAAMVMGDAPEFGVPDGPDTRPVGPLPGAEERKRELDRWKR